MERILLPGSCLIVLLVELLISAVEAAIDQIGDGHHRLWGRAKDMASDVVLVSLFTVLMTWGLIGYERFIIQLDAVCFFITNLDPRGLNHTTRQLPRAGQPC